MDWEKFYEIMKNEPPFRLRQAEQAVFGLAISSWNEASVLPKALKEILNKECPLENNPDKLIEQKGRVVKARLVFGEDPIETVLMRHPRRNTVCVSTQAGCPLKCRFCLTGEAGFKRNLSGNEILEQVLFFKKYLKNFDEEVDNVVFMGMGEPFLNYEEVVKAIKDINSKDKFNIGARKISVSTIGLPVEIIRFSTDCPQCNLAFSLHAPNDRLRSELIPANRKHPLRDVLPAIKEFQLTTNRRVMIEYIMLNDVNDREQDAEELARLLKDSLTPLFIVNLIKYNETGSYKPSPQNKIARFKNILMRNGLSVVERFRFGDNIKAACGQLGSECIKLKV